MGGHSRRGRVDNIREGLEWPLYNQERMPLSRRDTILYVDIVNEDGEPEKLTAADLTDEELVWGVERTLEYLHQAKTDIKLGRLTNLDPHYDKAILFVLNNEIAKRKEEGTWTM
jgi:hypothetical protein